MIERVERLPKPAPDVSQFLAALRRERPRYVPLLELKLDDEVAAALLGESLVPWRREASAAERRRANQQYIGLWHRLGYDAFRLRAPLNFRRLQDRTGDTAELSRGRREWQDEHTGPIQQLADMERYPWPDPGKLDFGQAEEIVRDLPEGMGCIGYASGVFEWTSWLMGLEAFMIAVVENRETVMAVADRVGEIIYRTLETFARMPNVVALWVGDDMGYKTGTMISPDDLRSLFLPWHARFAELAHGRGMPYMLHSCGNLTEIVPDLLENVRIDAKHSYEDVIQPAEDFHSKWGDRLAVVGGVDVDLLARGTEGEVVRRTMQILESCAPRGGYIAGSGNSVANYVRLENYLAVLETVHRFNGRM